jgi:hypothetical protein
MAKHILTLASGRCNVKLLQEQTVYVRSPLGENNPVAKNICFTNPTTFDQRASSVGSK